MACVQEKFDLIIRCCKVATEMESIGGIMYKHQPEIRLVVESCDYANIAITTRIQLHFPDGKFSEAINWLGYGKDFDEALDNNLLRLFYELQERQAKITQTLKELEPLILEVFPDEPIHSGINTQNT